MLSKFVYKNIFKIKITSSRATTPLRFLPFYFFLLTGYPLLAQIGVGEWRDHLPYSQGKFVAIAQNRIYCATEPAMFSYSLTDNSLEKFSKTTKLNDLEISTLEYNSTENVLVIAYKNANLDLLYENEIINLSDIKRKPTISYKSINSMAFDGEMAYLACSFGIVKLNLRAREFADTYYVGENGALTEIFDITIGAEKIYAISESGVLVANKNEAYLIDYTVWERPAQLQRENFRKLAWFDNKLWLVSSNITDTLYAYSPENGINAFWTADNKINSLRGGSHIGVAHADGVSLLNADGSIHRHYQNYEGNPILANDFRQGQNDEIWIAGQNKGLIHFIGNTAENMHPNGPVNSHAHHIVSAEGIVYVAGGGLDLSWNNVWNNPEIFTFYEENWYSDILWNSGANDLIHLAINPYNASNVFAASWGDGIFELQNRQLVTQYNQDNSTLSNISPHVADYIRVGGSAFDNQGNLWVTNSGTPTPLSVMSPDKKWKSFNIGNAVNAPTAGKVIVNQHNHKWIMLPRGHGLFIFDHQNTLDDQADDLYKKISLIDEKGSLITSQVYDIAEDRNGTIWVGTDKGPVIFNNPANFYEGDNFYAQQIRIFEEENDTVVQYLLESAIITAIKVDGANRKWLGTSGSGVFLVSADGQQTIANYTVENSPLISNLITSIGINDKTGEVFIGTDKGIVSHKGTATTGHDTFYDVYVFPNPVRPDYTGDITVTGLVTDVDVKITDIRGQLVYQTKALGGQAIWNGRDMLNRRVRTGVYLIFCTNEDGSKTYVSKLLFMN